MARRIVLPLLVILGLLLTVPAVSAKNGGGGGGGGYAGVLTANPSVVRSGDYFTVSGCGYDRAHGNVLVGFAGGSWGSALNAYGCFSIPDIPALSGDTLPAGTYTINAYQLVRKKWTVTGSTTLTVVP